MIVYADVLIFLNTLVDYFLLLATAKLCAFKVKTVRIVLASFAGGISSLYIFLPKQPIMLEIAFKIVLSLILTAICFKFECIKRFLKGSAVLFVITCAYAGVMFAFWVLSRPYGMVINNSVVYFNISPIVLVLCSAVAYILFSVLWRILSGSSLLATRCELTLFLGEHSTKIEAIADTGNSLEDTFGKSEVVIVDMHTANRLFGENFPENPDLQNRYRILPCSCVSGYSTLEAYRCDKAIVESGNKKIILEKPLAAISKVALADGYKAIINPKILR